MSIGRLYPWHREAQLRLMTALNNHQLAHAWLFCGPEHLGKLDFALAFVSSLLCEKPRETGACGDCSGCRLLKAGTHSDLRILTLEEDSKQIKIDQVRDFLEWAVQSTQAGGFKTAIIWPAERMNRNAANALLKYLEEPAGNRVIILVTHQPDRLPATIRSRCQRINFVAPPRNEAIEWLSRDIQDTALKERIAELLELARGAPLKVKRLFTDEYLKLREEFFSGLGDILAGKKTPLKMAAEFEKADLANLIELWFELLWEIQRKDYRTEPAAALEQGIIGKIQQYYGAENIFRFLDRLSEARKMLAANYNLNARLILEELLIGWSERNDPSSPNTY